VACGYTYHADLVAARNIDTLALGHRERLNACLPR
jgi:transposase